MSGKTSKLKRMHEKQEKIQQQVESLQANVRIEQVTRLAAQRGLVRYMKENGLRHRIGYDPDTDPNLNPLRPI